MAKRSRDAVEREIMDIIPERFDADADSQGARRGARTRWLLSIMLGVLALVAVGVAARHLLVGEGPRATSQANIPEIKPDSKPIKTKPDEPGGMAVPNQDKMVYSDVGKDKDNGPQAEQLAPAPEKPQPIVPAPKPAESNGSGAIPPPPPAVPPSKAAGGALAPSQPVEQTASAPAATAPAPEKKIETAAAPKPSEPASAAATPAPAAQDKKSEGPSPMKATSRAPVRAAAATPPPAPAKKTLETPSIANANTAAAPAPSAGGAWVVQVAAMKSEADAQSVWGKTQSANKDLLGALTLDIQKADLGAKGTYWRVRAGPLDESAAKALCAKLAERKQGCLVARK